MADISYQDKNKPKVVISQGNPLPSAENRQMAQESLRRLGQIDKKSLRHGRFGQAAAVVGFEQFLYGHADVVDRIPFFRIISGDHMTLPKRTR